MLSSTVVRASLRRPVDHGIFDRIDVGNAGERFEYRLTQKGEALLTVLTALREWSDEWVFGRGNEPLIVRERKTNKGVVTIVKRSVLRALSAVVTALCFSVAFAWAATTAPNVMYFHCYGPQAKDGVPPPPKVYVSGVSSTVYSEANRDAASKAFRQFIAGKYGTDFEPRCEYSGTELAAKKLVSILQSRFRSAAVMTGWTWPGAANEATLPAQPPP